MRISSKRNKTLTSLASLRAVTIIDLLEEEDQIRERLLHRTLNGDSLDRGKTAFVKRSGQCNRTHQMSPKRGGGNETVFMQRGY